MKRRHIISILLFLPILSVFSQKESKDVRQGNKLYNEGKYTDADVAYRMGLDKNKESFEATFNLGNALYKQGKYDEAVEQYVKASSLNQDKQKVASALHNVGNALYSAKQYDKSLEAYKHALKLNPNDEETRYNYALTKKMLQKQQQQQNKDNKNDKKQDKDKQQQQQNQDKKQQQQQQNQMSEENAQQILDAMLQDEKDVQNRVKENQKINAKRRNVEKDW